MRTSTEPLITLVDSRAGDGDRDMVLFIAGLGGNDRQWDDVIPLLRREHDIDVGYGPAALSHPAFRDARMTVARLSHAVAEELRTRSPRSVLLVSHSVGAFIALAIARELPETITGIVIVNGGLTTVGRFIDAPLRQLVRHPRECFAYLHLFTMISMPLPKPVKRWIAGQRWLSRLLVGRLVSDEALDTETRRRSLLENTGSGRVLQLLRDNRHHWHEFLSYADEIGVECVFVVGDRDPMTTIEDTHEMAALLPSARIEILRGIGHAAPLEAPESVTEVIEQQLACREPIRTNPQTP